MDRREFIAGGAGLIAIRGKDQAPSLMVAEKDRFPKADSDTAAFVADNPGYVIVEGLLYDRVQVRAGHDRLTVASFFVDVGPASDKGLSDTNLYRSMALSPPEQFLANAISVVAHPSINGEDHAALERWGYWQFMVGQRRYAGAPLLMNGPYSLKRAGGVRIIHDLLFWLDVRMKQPYTFKASADLLAALHGIHAQGVC
jgi:hypothetical protein